MSPARKHHLTYLGIQLAAWSTYVALLGLPVWLDGSFTSDYGSVLVVMACIGIAGSHVLRACFLKWDWLAMRIDKLLVRTIGGAVVLGAGAGLLQATLHDVVFDHVEPVLSGNGRHLMEILLSWMLQLLAWAVIYIAYHYIVRSRIEELKALRLGAANRENQLANLRSQLNPHFMFNALNSIRGLIGEDPDRAQRSITQLSAILRNAMATVKRRTVPLGEEIDMVRAYLALESMRFEERLRVHFDVDPLLERAPVPPMMLQTLVENAVRHGIGKLKKGGDIHIEVRTGPPGMVLRIRNSGRFTAQQDDGRGGIGLHNTEERLRHIYGDSASLNIGNEEGMVVCEVRLPIQERVDPYLERDQHQHMST